MAGKGSIFGDKYLWNKNITKNLESDILMGSDGVLSQISVADFYRNIKCTDGNVEAILEKNKESHE